MLKMYVHNKSKYICSVYFFFVFELRYINFACTHKHQTPAEQFDFIIIEEIKNKKKIVLDHPCFS